MTDTEPIMQRKMKISTITQTALILAATLAISCGGGSTPVERTNTEPEPEPEHHNPVFSLFEGDDSYHVYRNSERLANFPIENSRRVIDLKSYKNDCFILISEGQTQDSAAPQPIPPEIYKNGRKAMTFDPSLKAVAFDMDEGHFYVLGLLGDNVYTIYRDGLRVMDLAKKQDTKPVDISVFGQTIYTAMQHGSSVEIFKDKNRMFSIPGKCKDIQVSLRGVYTLCDDTLYLDNSAIMRNEYYRNADKEMHAVPKLLAVGNKHMLVGCSSSFDAEHTYCCIFKNQQPMITTSPDEQRIGKSTMSTKCVGVAISNETMYYTDIVLTPDFEPAEPLTFRYYTDHDKIFNITFTNPQTKLLFTTSN